MSGKVISLAARRTKRIGLSWWGMWGKPISRPMYDAWIEADGSLVLRFDPAAVDSSKHGGAFVDPETDKPIFVVRSAGHEVRIPADGAADWFKDMQSFQIANRRIAETRRGVHEWRCEPIEGGRYRVTHEHRCSVFEPFKPRLRREMVRTGEVVETPWGPQHEYKRAMVAPACAACRRVIQVGETAYREQRNPHGRNFGDAVLCVDCIRKTPGEGLREVSR